MLNIILRRTAKKKKGFENVANQKKNQQEN